jgi:hypothetical protein
VCQGAEKVVFDGLQVRGHGPKHLPGLRRSLERLSILARKETRLQLADPVKTFGQRQSRRASEMALESKLVELVVVEASKARCTAKKRSYEA